MGNLYIKYELKCDSIVRCGLLLALVWLDADNAVLMRLHVCPSDN